MGERCEPAAMEGMGITVFRHIHDHDRQRSKAFQNGDWFAHHPATNGILGSRAGQTDPGEPVLSVLHWA